MGNNKNLLAARFRNINMLFVIFILITIMAVSAVMIFTLTDSASKSYVHSYSMETAHILASYLNREITLVRQAAETREIIEWFADENNPVKKEAAYNRMMHYADMLQIGSVYFVITDSLNEYSINKGDPYTKFTHFNILDKEELYDQWFFEAINSDYDFKLNLDVDKITNTRRIWINYKVMYNGNPLGIFCSALQFDDMFAELFSLYDRHRVIGYIIDENGIIKISSYIPEPDLIQEDFTIQDIDEDRHILDVNSNAAFIAAIKARLENPVIHYSPRVETDVIKLSRGNYQYMSIAPIPNTNWFSVTFFSSRGLFDVKSILIPIIIVVLSFVFYVITSSLLIQQVVFKPLHLFTQSVSEALNGKNTDIYGIKRDDELGDLARTAKKTWNRINKNSADLKHRDHLLETVNQAANILLSSEFDQFEANLHHCMGIMAAVIDVSRVRIWRNHTIDRQLYCTQLYEWSEGVPPQQGNKYTISISYDKSIPGWEETLSRGECINKIVKNMSKAEQEQLSPQGVLSLLVVPVFLNERFWGFVGYDCCNNERHFEEIEEAIMRSASLMVANALVRHDMTQNLRDSAVKLEDARNEAETASRSKSVFLANMSHEIRTPMNAILGVTEILIQKEKLPIEIEEGLEKIYSSCDMLLGIINDILDFSKIEAGKLNIIPAMYSIASLLNDSAQLNMMRVNSKPIEFELFADENIPVKLIGDEIRIKQILNNLLSNAFKYTDVGKVTLSVFSELRSEKDEITLVLKVKDTGLGMSEEQLGRLYGEYLRFNEENRRTVEGTGLGLAITHRLVRIMNGEIHVESKPGIGSTFVVRLPQKIADNEVLGKEAAENLKQFRMNYKTHRQRGQVTRDPMPYGSVLIVDDVETNLYVAEGLMKLYKLQIDTVMSGQEAIDKIKNGNKYDVVFMDHMMPEMDGIEATLKIRKWEVLQGDNLLYQVPIVALTANAVAGQADIFLQNGFNDFISKPIDIRQLNTVLNKYIRDKQPPEVIEAARQLENEFTGLDNGSNGKLDHGNDYSAAQIQADPLLLDSFIRDARKAVVILEEMENINTDEGLHKYTITVHGMKSSLWNIGETTLSELARKLEQEVRNLNIDYIKTHTQEFLTGLNDLINKHELEYNTRIADKTGNENEDKNYIKDKLLLISKMCDDYNRKGVLDCIAAITNCSAKTIAVLDKIKEYVTHSEFDEAEKTAISYADELQI
ncbi:MAG: ATP-binding protein [Treponema sp.]|nr:ATP-binding protein [Treponema sp.]